MSSQPARRRVVLSGIGVIAPSGIGQGAFWENLKRGTPAIRTITRFDPSRFLAQMAGEVVGFDPLAYLTPERARALSLTSRFGIAAVKMALADARLDLSTLDRDRIAVLHGTTLGGFDYPEIVTRHASYNGGPPVAAFRPDDALMPYPEFTATEIGRELDLHGPCLTFSNTCSSSLDCVGHAFRAIRAGRLDLAIAGGAQAPITEPLLSTFCQLRGVSTRNDDPSAASRPFDRDRDGFVVGEGAGFLIVEEFQHAVARGAPLYGEVMGYAQTCDAHHLTNPRPDGRDAARAVHLALRAAGVAPAEIDYVSAHATSTPLGDRTETKILKDVFGERIRKVPISAVKSMFGHLIGAAGSVELIALLLALRDQIVPPTINYRTPDLECDLDYVPNEARPAHIRTALKNSFGFGGKNSVMVVRAVA